MKYRIKVNDDGWYYAEEYYIWGNIIPVWKFVSTTYSRSPEETKQRLLTVIAKRTTPSVVEEFEL